MDWEFVTIPLPNTTRARRAYASYARKLRTIARSPKRAELATSGRRKILAFIPTIPSHHQATFRASAMILTDLVMQGWQLKVSRDNQVAVARPETSRCRETARAEIRMQELLKRDEQLAKPSVKSFLTSVERKRLFKDQFVSIFSLMRDGRELSESLRQARTSSLNGEGLADVVKPYVQFVDATKRCEFTGMRVMDIWRYFRHTWTNQYSSVPGRNMMLLIRDSAAKNHPVMGIASLCSPIIQISERDKWLGWHPDAFLDRIRSEPSARLAHWLVSTVDSAIDEIYTADFIKERRLSRWAIDRPNEKSIAQLRKYAVQQKKRHQRYSRSADFKHGESNRKSVKHWRNQACTPLFKSKRAQALADLLELRMLFDSHFGNRHSATDLSALVESAAGRRAVSKVIRKAKADRVGIAMADINVCGAVQPYNALLGGKLVSMLAVGPTVVNEYKRRYKNAVSQIASSMAGRPITRPSNLVFLGTTSLYGKGSSQYNRIKIPANLLGGVNGDEITYKEIGESESYGTSQFSNETMDAIVECLRQSTNGERINSIFGEGVSPKLRKAREGLALLGFPHKKLLQHQRRRSVYGVILVQNLKDYLIGLDRRPKYVYSTSAIADAEDSIVAWWRHRWLSGRILSDAVLEQVAEHQHVHPVRHGARVATDDQREAEAEADGGTV